MLVRNLQWSDFPDLMENYYSIYEEVKENSSVGIFLFPEKPSIANEVRWFGNFYAEVLEGKQFASVAEVDGRAVGLCQVGCKAPHKELQHSGELGILIRKGYRGQGVGSSLLAHILAQCRGKLEFVTLGVFSNNEPAKRLYSKFGFERVGQHPHRIRRGPLYFDEDLMQLDMARFLPPSLKPRGPSTPGK